MQARLQAGDGQRKDHVPVLPCMRAVSRVKPEIGRSVLIRLGFNDGADFQGLATAGNFERNDLANMAESYCPRQLGRVEDLFAVKSNDHVAAPEACLFP